MPQIDCFCTLWGDLKKKLIALHTPIFYVICKTITKQLVITSSLKKQTPKLNAISCMWQWKTPKLKRCFTCVQDLWEKIFCIYLLHFLVLLGNAGYKYLCRLWRSCWWINRNVFPSWFLNVGYIAGYLIYYTNFKQYIGICKFIYRLKKSFYAMQEVNAGLTGCTDIWTVILLFWYSCCASDKHVSLLTYIFSRSIILCKILLVCKY